MSWQYPDETDETKNINLNLPGRHRCELNSPDKAWGIAIKYCYEDADGKLWAGNTEYESQVNFCPVCGVKANNTTTSCCINR